MATVSPEYQIKKRGASWSAKWRTRDFKQASKRAPQGKNFSFHADGTNMRRWSAGNIRKPSQSTRLIFFSQQGLFSLFLSQACHQRTSVHVSRLKVCKNSCLECVSFNLFFYCFFIAQVQKWNSLPSGTEGKIKQLKETIKVLRPNSTAWVTGDKSPTARDERNYPSLLMY